MKTAGLIPQLQEALARGGDTHTLEDVLDMIDRGAAQMWTADNAIIISEVHTSPRSKAVHIWLAAGKLDDVVRLSHRVMDWARDEGCDSATLTGRRGWEKALKSEGWTNRLTMMGRSLNG